MSRESNLSQINFERLSVEQQASTERGPDEIISVPNPGVIVIPTERAYEFPLGLSGSLTKLIDGSDYLIAGSNISLMTGANGSITISTTAGGGGGVSAGGSSTQVQYNDGGSVLGGDSAFTFNENTDTLTVTNIRGSLTKLANGDPYLNAGPGITLSTGALGSVWIGTVDASVTWESYTPTITGTDTNPSMPSTHSITGKYVVQGKLMTVIFNYFGNSSLGASAGSGTYIISLPPTKQVDSSVATFGSIGQNYANGTPVGVASLLYSELGSGGAWSVIPVSANTVVLSGQDPTSSSGPALWGSSKYPLNSTGPFRITFVATLPII